MDYNNTRKGTNRGSNFPQQQQINTSYPGPPQMYNPQIYNPVGYQPESQQLYEDTSIPPSQYASSSYPAPSMLQDPAVANMAMQYGQVMVGQGRDIVEKQLSQYVSVTNLKYYFAVDTKYVAKKLALLLFPFSHSDWSIRYQPGEPIQPRHEINAPDLYIPVMAYVTYILVAGLVLGMQNRFTPEQLGIQASSALVWLVIEVAAILLFMYIVGITSAIKTYSLIAYCSYKFVGMIVALLGALVFGTSGYFVTMAYCSLTLAFFLVRTLKIQMQHEPDGDNKMYHQDIGSKRRTYLLLSVALIQPLLMYWLTYAVK